MISNQIKKAIYLDIETLLDTRYTILEEFDSSFLEKIILNNYYYERVLDEFDYLTYRNFKTLYRYRDIETLKSSMLTSITDLIYLDVGLINNSMLVGSGYTPVTIDLNTYPYKISNSHQELLRASLKKKLSFTDVDINVIYNDPLKYLLGDLNIRYYNIYMYNGMHWLEYMINIYGIEKQSAPNLILSVPALLDRVVDLPRDKIEEIFKQSRDLLTPLITLRHIPIKYMSIDLK